MFMCAIGAAAREGHTSVRPTAVVVYTGDWNQWVVVVVGWRWEVRAPWPRHMYKLASVVSPVSTSGQRINAPAELGSTIFVSKDTC